MVGWHPRHDGHEFEQTPGDSEGQGSLGVYSIGSQGARRNFVPEQQQKTDTKRKI